MRKFAQLFEQLSDMISRGKHGDFRCSRHRALAGAYLVKYAPKDAQDKRFVSESPTLPQAIERAREKLPHVRDVWIEATKKAADLLKPLASRIAECENFDDLHQFICDNLQSVSGIGPLTCYDFAYLIGAWLKKEPTEVYLPRGYAQGCTGGTGRAGQSRPPARERFSGRITTLADSGTNRGRALHLSRAARADCG